MDIYAAALPGCPRLGAKHMRALMDYFETAEDVWKASAESIEKSHILTGKTLAAFLAYRNETSLEQIEEKLYQLDIRCSAFEDSDYPPLLSATANPPAVLFYRGALPCFERTIAVVGSRKATAYGIETAHELARGLSAHGITIVSGGKRDRQRIAYGCDGRRIADRGRAGVRSGPRISTGEPPSVPSGDRERRDTGFRVPARYAAAWPPVSCEKPHHRWNEPRDTRRGGG